MNLTTFLQGDEFDADMEQNGLPKVIAEGNRNATMSRFAGRVLKRLGKAAFPNQNIRGGNRYLSGI